MQRAAELGAEIVREFVEYGSARVSTAERPILQDMLHFLDARRDIAHVVCFNQSRLAHTARSYVEIMQAVEATGADIAIAALPDLDETKGGDK